MNLRPFQQVAVKHAIEWSNAARPGDFIVYAGPTGCGKSVIEQEVQSATNAFIVTPRLQIARGILEKRGIVPPTMGELIRACEAHDIWTPVRFRNALFDGRIKREVLRVIVDEGHHQLASSYRDVWLACGMPPTMLYTATPYRGTARATMQFREHFGEPVWVISIREAAQLKYVSIPECTVLPLVDDDVIELTSAGDFDVTQLENATIDRLQDVARVAAAWFDDPAWDRVTCFVVPTVNLARRLAALLPASAVITAATPDSLRQLIFQQLVERRLALIQVSVVGEGVDLPIRRLVDLSPCMSPVKWLQQVGRATRPRDSPPEYICTNRNLLRHAYLLEGLVPAAKLAECTLAFGPSTRDEGHRALGLESLGRFKAVRLPLVDGNIATMYMLVDSSNGKLTEYACLVHPAWTEAVWARRDHKNRDDGTRDWGRWVRVAQPVGLHGFVSQAPRAPTEKQVKWWQKSARGWGLEPDVDLTRKNFAALPLVMDIGVRLARSKE